MPRALIIWDADYPWDVRVEKVATALLHGGYDVHILARNRARRAVVEQLDGMTIHRLSPLPSWMGRLNDGYTFPAFINPVWVAAVRRLLRRLRPDLLIVRDLPLAPLAVVAGRRAGIPVLWDMAESYPEMIRNVWTFGPRKLRNLVLRNPWLAEMTERFVLARADRIAVVVDEAGARLVAKGADPSRIVLVSNTPDPAAFVPSSAPAEDGDSLRLVYVGLLGRSRGLDIALRGLAEYLARGRPARLEIVGTGSSQDELEELVLRRNLGAMVEFRGWIDRKLVPSIIQGSDVGIIPHRRCGHWDTTIPNKLFDYMASGKPVLASNTPPMARILGSTGAGVVYQDDSPKAFADALAQLERPEERASMGNSGRRAVEQEFNWNLDSTRLLEVLGSMRTTSSLR